MRSAEMIQVTPQRAAPISSGICLLSVDWELSGYRNTSRLKLQGSKLVGWFKRRDKRFKKSLAVFPSIYLCTEEID